MEKTNAHLDRARSKLAALRTFTVHVISEALAYIEHDSSDLRFKNIIVLVSIILASIGIYTTAMGMEAFFPKETFFGIPNTRLSWAAALGVEVVMLIAAWRIGHVIAHKKPLLMIAFIYFQCFCMSIFFSVAFMYQNLFSDQKLVDLNRQAQQVRTELVALGRNHIAQADRSHMLVEATKDQVDQISSNAIKVKQAAIGAHVQVNRFHETLQKHSNDLASESLKARERAEGNTTIIRNLEKQLQSTNIDNKKAREIKKRIDVARQDRDALTANTQTMAQQESVVSGVMKEIKATSEMLSNVPGKVESFLGAIKTQSYSAIQPQGLMDPRSACREVGQTISRLDERLKGASKDAGQQTQRVLASFVSSLSTEISALKALDCAALPSDESSIGAIRSTLTASLENKCLASPRAPSDNPNGSAIAVLDSLTGCFDMVSEILPKIKTQSSAASDRLSASYARIDALRRSFDPKIHPFILAIHQARHMDTAFFVSVSVSFGLLSLPLLCSLATRRYALLSARTPKDYEYMDEYPYEIVFQAGLTNPRSRQEYAEHLEMILEQGRFMPIQYSDARGLWFSIDVIKDNNLEDQFQILFAMGKVKLFDLNTGKEIVSADASRSILSRFFSSISIYGKQREQSPDKIPRLGSEIFNKKKEASDGDVHRLRGGDWNEASDDPATLAVELSSEVVLWMRGELHKAKKRERQLTKHMNDFVAEPQSS